MIILGLIVSNTAGQIDGHDTWKLTELMPAPILSYYLEVNFLIRTLGYISLVADKVSMKDLTINLA